MTVSILRLRELNVQGKKAAEMSEKERGKKKVEGIPISVAQAQVQQGAERNFMQEHYQGQSLTRLEPKGPGDLHWLPYWATSGSMDSFTQQVVLQWIWPQVLFDNLSNPVRLWKAVV